MNLSVLIDGDDLTRLHVTDEFRVDGMKSAALGRENVCPVSLSDAQRTQAPRVPDTDQLARTHHDERVSSSELCHRFFDRDFNARRFDAFPGDAVGNDLGINGCVKNRAGVLHFFPKLIGIYKVSVVRQSERTLDVIQDKRLCVVHVERAGSGITDMADTNVALQILKLISLKYLVQKPQSAVGIHASFRPVGIGHRNAAGFLSAVLQSFQTKIDGPADISAVRIIDSEHTALLF